MTKVGIVIEDSDKPNSYFCVLQRNNPGKFKTVYSEGIGNLFTDISKKIVIIEKTKALLNITRLNIFLKSYKNRNEIKKRKFSIKKALSVTV